jgi:hypothetical protein
VLAHGPERLPPGAAGLAFIRVQEGGAIDAAKPIKEGLSAEQAAALIAAAGAQPVRRGAREGEGEDGEAPGRRAAPWSPASGGRRKASRRPPDRPRPVKRNLVLVSSFAPQPLLLRLLTPNAQIFSRNSVPFLAHHATPESIDSNSQGDLLLLAAGPEATVHRALDRVRLFLGRDLGLIDASKDSLLWVTDFPMFEWNEDEQRLEALHHPFTAPNPEDLAAADGDVRGARALAYDLVYNGVEIGGGSLRIYR